MKVTALLVPLLSLSTALASPTGEQVVLGLERLTSKLDAAHAVDEWLDDAKKAILRGKHNLEKWIHDGKEYIKQNELLCTLAAAQGPVHEPDEAAQTSLFRILHSRTTNCESLNRRSVTRL